MLVFILAFPIVAALFILFALKEEQKAQIRLISAITMLAVLVASLVVFLEANQPATLEAAQKAALENKSYFIEDFSVNWVPALGIKFHVGVDGVTAPMVLLTGLAGFCGVLISWKIEDRVREFMAFFLLLVAGVYGVFVSLDMFLLFFWYELAIFPMYLLIAGWGWVVTREYASMKLTLYILIGSVIALVGMLVLYFSAGTFFSQNGRLAILQDHLGDKTAQAYSFDFNHLEAATHWKEISQKATGTAESGPFDIVENGSSIARLWFPFIFLGFAVLAGIFPFHNWSPDGHVAAPTAVSMIHAGVLMKLGAYAALRVGVQLLPEGAKLHLPWIILLTLVNVVYGAFIAFRQRDFKYVIGFSSVSHMGLVSMGIASMNIIGMTGAGLQMFSHGAMTALFFSCVGMVYDQAHTRDIPSLSGFGKKMPFVAVAFVVGGLVSMGMPGLSGFIAEFPIFQGVWNGPVFAVAGVNPQAQYFFPNFNYFGIIAILSALAIVVTAAYVLRVTGQVFGGEFNEQRFPGIKDVTILDKTALVLLAASLLVLGVYPQIMSNMIQYGMQPIVNLLK